MIQDTLNILSDVNVYTRGEDGDGAESEGMEAGMSHAVKVHLLQHKTDTIFIALLVFVL